MRGLDPRIASVSRESVPDAVQREAVHRCFGTVAKAVYVAIPGLRRTIPP